MKTTQPARKILDFFKKTKTKTSTTTHLNPETTTTESNTQIWEFFFPKTSNEFNITATTKATKANNQNPVFTSAAEIAQKLKLTKKLTNHELLDLYGLFNQATIGDNNTSEPMVFDMKGQAKWDAWYSFKGVSCEEAEAAFINRVNQIFQKYGFTE